MVTNHPQFLRIEVERPLGAQRAEAVVVESSDRNDAGRDRCIVLGSTRRLDGAHREPFDDRIHQQPFDHGVQKRVVEAVLELDAHAGGGVMHVEFEHLRCGHHGICRRVGHPREQRDLDRAPARCRPGALLEQRIDEQAVQLLTVVLRELTVHVHQVGNVYFTDRRQPERGSSVVDTADARIGVDRANGHAMP